MNNHLKSFSILLLYKSSHVFSTLSPHSNSSSGVTWTLSSKLSSSSLVIFFIFSWFSFIFALYLISCLRSLSYHSFSHFCCIFLAYFGIGSCFNHLSYSSSVLGRYSYFYLKNSSLYFLVYSSTSMSCLLGYSQWPFSGLLNMISSSSSNYSGNQLKLVIWLFHLFFGLPVTRHHNVSQKSFV